MYFGYVPGNMEVSHGSRHESRSGGKNTKNRVLHRLFWSNLDHNRVFNAPFTCVAKLTLESNAEVSPLFLGG